MSDIIVHTSDPLTLVGGGDATPQDVHEALSLAPKAIAVDGGLAHLDAAGVAPDCVIGDLDSADPDLLAHVPPSRQHRVTEQQTTDFDKALRSVAAPVVVGVGFCGGRMDHQLAAFHTLAVHCQQPCVLVGTDEIVFLAPPFLGLPTQEGDVVSLFPLGRVTGHSTGLAWPIGTLMFDPLSFIGTSNRASGPMTLEMRAPAMLVIVPRRFMQPVVAQLRPQWHAREK